MVVSMDNGQVLTIFNSANRTIEDVKQEASQRIDNLKIPGKLLDDSLKVIAAFDSFGKEIIK
ncbi:hypothetical protein GECvBMG_gp231c [Salmonella phage GEC_vB_MG]|uniref:Uncharacterized protein 195 n=2 Tax=Seunavirus TaxID=1914851 RepID=G3BM61_9CAUD|nr:hypothetical protein PVP-SE1_gp195 [Salmonella phage PVPSE1]YP_009148925.1 hypothetical protein ACQ19_gp129 [Salmonella phage SSE121]ADP02591.1 hypothetical protein [Salmonella phage PVPSE1]AFU63770.1 hypothetical protein [Salmonella phage SSE121]QPI14775.1 hypothetical protein GECvBMG_gp231c [Salmonella phage GEC_vB_MG]